MPAFNEEDLSLYKAPFKMQLRQLLDRQKLFTRREPQVAYSKIFNQIFIGFLILFLYWGGTNNPKSKRDIFNIGGLAFLMIVNQLMGYFFGTVLTF